MEDIINRLNDQQREELIRALYKVDDILESNADDFEEYHTSRFYEDLYDLMHRLGQWC